ncbi:MAG: phosphoglycerate kinase [Alphaproteobacteria bacterium]|nr:phosphoglycerate kinase [Alphaproteobacteria bacterium]
MEMKLRTIDYNSVRGKYVLLRVDFNVQIENGKILDTFRIEQSMPTINKLRDAGARVAICAHLGRPGGVATPELSLRPVSDYMKIPFVADCLDKKFLAGMRDGDIVLMENVRFYAGEEKNDAEFAGALARGFDLFVNDAFAVAHRAAASTVGVAKILPSFAGDLLNAEVENISRIMESPRRPLLAIVGGAKVSSKIGVLKTLCKLADTVIVGGAIGTTFNYACGANPGNSLYEPDMVATAREIMDIAAANNCKFLMPIDKGVGAKFEKTAKRENKSLDEITARDVIIDDGPRTADRNIDEINRAATVVWNGTFGMAEWGDVWGQSSFRVARAIAERTAAGKLVSVVGGGETVAAVDAAGVRGDITYVSTGGGAFLEFIEQGTLPAIEVLAV